MTETMLLRLAMVLQNQAPSTLNKYICKLAEAILMEYPDGLSVYALQEALVEHFHLFEQKVSPGVNAFEATAEEITTINEFITWDNSKKNSIIYRLIAICYEYCMLTIKKDNMLSAELFRGKRFYLDANIIFRMAGINNEERKTVTQNFVRHCQEASIELYCTTATLDEIYRVVAAQVGFIKGIAGSSMPVSSSMLELSSGHLKLTPFTHGYLIFFLRR
ncbi:hypothetical protein [Dysosmobacter sp.]|uniref:hypothetical protein n=1 Tax=Dysosmobacter sp. TaxID=2591382 RepID=UPI003A95417D